jgi:hypothetical protein
MMRDTDNARQTPPDEPACGIPGTLPLSRPDLVRDVATPAGSTILTPHSSPLTDTAILTNDVEPMGAMEFDDL